MPIAGEMSKKNRRKAFSLLEIAMTVTITTLLIVAVAQGAAAINKTKLYAARGLTKNSPVTGIEGLTLWLETTSENSITTTNHGFSPRDGDAVSSWNDIGNQVLIKNNATQAISANQPIYESDGVNGLPVLRFTTNDFFNLPNGTVPYDNSPYSVFFVSRVNSACVCGVIGSGDFTNNKSNSFRYDATSGIFNYWWTVNPFSGNNSITVNKFDIIEVVYNTSSVSFYVNGVAKTSAAYSNRASTSANNTIGRTWAAEYMNGDIAEIIIFNRALKEDERESVERYLAKKWAIRLL